MNFKNWNEMTILLLQPASKDQLMAIIEKAKANLPAKPQKTKKAPAKAAPVESYDEQDTSPKQTSRPLSTASSDGIPDSKPTKTVKGKGKAVSVHDIYTSLLLKLCSKLTRFKGIAFSPIFYFVVNEINTNLEQTIAAMATFLKIMLLLPHHYAWND